MPQCPSLHHRLVQLLADELLVVRAVVVVPLAGAILQNTDAVLVEVVVGLAVGPVDVVVLGAVIPLEVAVILEVVEPDPGVGRVEVVGDDVLLGLVDDRHEVAAIGLAGGLGLAPRGGVGREVVAVVADVIPARRTAGGGDGSQSREKQHGAQHGEAEASVW